MDKVRDRVEDTEHRIAQSIDEATDSETIVSSMCLGIEEYRKTIRDFFMDSSGKEIKEVYGKLKSLDYARNTVINTIDVNYGSSIYFEYYDGMRLFIIKLSESVKKADYNNIADCSGKIDTAFDADKKFIDSLCGGKNNSVKEEVLTDAVKNFEYMIDFNDVLSDMDHDLKTLIRETLDQDGSPKNETVVKAMKLLAGSMNTFISKTISSMLSTYSYILDAVSGNPTAPYLESTDFVLI